MKKIVLLVSLLLAASAAQADYNPSIYNAATVPTTVPVHGKGDATSGLQSVLNLAAQNRSPGIGSLPVAFSTAYDFTTLQITAGETLFFNTSTFNAVASSPTDAAIVLNGDFNKIRDLRLVGPYSTANYTSLIHWFTPNIATYYPGFNHIDDLYTEGCDICVDIGMPPSQYNKSAGAAGLWGLSSTPTTAPNAMNSPLSEAYINGWISNGAIRPLYMAQTNAKITFANAQIIADANQWANPTWANVSALTMLASSSVNIATSSIEALPATTTGRLMDLEDQSTTFLVSDILEANVPIYLSDQSSLFITQAANFGFNMSTEPFVVNSNWTGVASLSNEGLFRLPTSTTPMIRTVSSWGGSVSPNLNGIFQFSNVVFQNYGSTSMWNPVNDNQFCGYMTCQFKNDFLQTLNASTGVITSNYVLDDGEDVLKSAVDETGSTAPVYPSTSTSSVGGWAITLGGTGQWGKNCAVPAINTLGQVCAYELAGNGANNSNYAQLASAKMFIRTNKLSTLRFYGNNNNGNGTLQITLFYWDQAGNAMSHASDYLFNSTVSAFQPAWAPHTFILPPPCSASPVYPCIPQGTAQVSIQFYVDTGGTFLFLQPSIE